MGTPLAYSRLDFNNMITMFNFLPADEDNLELQKMLQSDQTAREEDEMECDITKHTKRTTNLHRQLPCQSVPSLHLHCNIHVFHTSYVQKWERIVSPQGVYEPTHVHVRQKLRRIWLVSF